MNQRLALVFTYLLAQNGHKTAHVKSLKTQSRTRKMVSVSPTKKKKRKGRLASFHYYPVGQALCLIKAVRPTSAPKRIDRSGFTSFLFPIRLFLFFLFHNHFFSQYYQSHGNVDLGWHQLTFFLFSFPGPRPRLMHARRLSDYTAHLKTCLSASLYTTARLQTHVRSRHCFFSSAPSQDATRLRAFGWPALLHGLHLPVLALGPPHLSGT